MHWSPAQNKHVPLKNLNIKDYKGEEFISSPNNLYNPNALSEQLKAEAKRSPEVRLGTGAYGDSSMGGGSVAAQNDMLKRTAPGTATKKSENRIGDADLNKGKKSSGFRTRKRLEQQAIDIAKGKFDAAVKPVSPTEAK